MSRCRWVQDDDVPGGKFLVPGCWNRAVGSDDAECQCADDPETVEDRIEALSRKVAMLTAEIEKLRGVKP